MRNRKRYIGLLIAFALANAQSRPAMTRETFDQWMTELSNWGRWGKEDEMGAINLITPAKRKQAAALVKEGASFSLARDAEKEKAVDNPVPFGHQMTRTGVNNPGNSSGDTFTISHHGYAHTHMDSLCHFFYKGKMFNGYAQEIVTERGAGKLSINNFKNGIVTRGVLMDMARLKGVDYLEPGTPIYPEDLDAWEKKARVKVGNGATWTMAVGAIDIQIRASAVLELTVEVIGAGKSWVIGHVLLIKVGRKQSDMIPGTKLVVANARGE